MALSDQIDRLAEFEPSPFPVVSLYLNAQPSQHGRDQFHTFTRKEFKARGTTYPPNSRERASLEQDLDRIVRYLDTELEPSANGVAIFACSAAGLFEAVQMGAPIDHHWLYVGDRPHLYPLARVDSRYPRYIAVLADTNASRILVFAAGALVAEREVKGVKTRRTSEGGWSQARFQRHIENFHLHHTKDLVDTLERIVLQEGIDQIVVAGDEVITPLLREQMPKHIADKIVEHMRLDTNAPLDDVIRASLEAMKRASHRTVREKVEAAVGAYRAGGLGIVGPEDTLDALVKGQVDELLLTSSMSDLHGIGDRTAARTEPGGADTMAEPAVAALAGETADASGEAVRLADELVTKARQTGARTTFVEEPSLLMSYGGVAALLRFRI
jgi:peptide subunit release factor 1 (eRF1)